MSPWEEDVLFTYEVGELIMGWSTVESDLCAIAGTFTNGEPTFAKAYSAIENLRAKLQFTDTIVRHATQNEVLLGEWKKLHDRIGRVARGRNKAAHYPSRCYTNYPIVGRRWALVPWDAPPMDASEGPPAGSICLRDIALINHQLDALCGATQNFLWLVHGMPPALPDDEKASAKSAEIRAMRNRLRLMLGLPRLPNRSTPRKAVDGAARRAP